MKMTFILLILAAIGAGYIFRQTHKSVPAQPTDQTIIAQPTIAATPDFEVSLENRTFFVFWQNIRGNNLSLIPNFENRRTSTQQMEEYTCAYGVNGGFYTKDYKPIGLFTSEGKTLSAPILDQTFNGFFVKESDGELLITKRPPSDLVSFALQSGPYINRQTSLRIKNDDFERRMVVAKTGDDIWYFIALTEKDNPFGGPQLAQVPKILQLLPLGLDEALNLDGGSASAFHNTNGMHLGELTPIGSFFCGK